MSLELVKKVADAVLFEGYLLYPYRASAVKNRQRFNFGVLLPPAYAEAQSGNDASSMKTECLVEGDAPRLDVRVRFLQAVNRHVGRLVVAGKTSPAARYEIVPELEIAGEIYQSWQEAIEREVVVCDLSCADLVNEPRSLRWKGEPTEEIEPLNDSQGQASGALIRRRDEIDCTVDIRAERVADRLWKIAVTVDNRTPFQAADTTREDALPRSLIAAHTLLATRDGQFVSLLEPPEAFADACANCENKGTWPVLIGAEGERGWMLSSPIILYDYPQIAPESDGDFFDGLEIDEMLALRVMTLTDDEKRQMRNVDRRAREILERTESLPQDRFRKLHGTIRGLKPTGGI